MGNLFEWIWLWHSSHIGKVKSSRSTFTQTRLLKRRVWIGQCSLLGHREDLPPSKRTIEVAVVRIKKTDIRGKMEPSSVFMPADTDTMTAIKSLYDTYDLIQGKVPSFLTFQDQTWWWKDKIYVPSSMRQLILKEYHESPTAGHWGIMKTLDMISRTFAWPNCRSDVLQFIKECRSCQAIKVDHRPPQGLLNPLPIPDRPWANIGVDFIVKLLISLGFDSVMVIVDHFSKAAHFIPAKESWSAEEMAFSFVKEVFRIHGLQEKIFSDRGTLFMLKFWTAVLAHLGISSAPSTAFHPQTDGQVERINALLEDYLRHFCSEQQNNW